MGTWMCCAMRLPYVYLYLRKLYFRKIYFREVLIRVREKDYLSRSENAWIQIRHGSSSKAFFSQTSLRRLVQRRVPSRDPRGSVIFFSFSRNEARMSLRFCFVKEKKRNKLEPRDKHVNNNNNSKYVCPYYFWNILCDIIIGLRGWMVEIYWKSKGQSLRTLEKDSAASEEGEMSAGTQGEIRVGPSHQVCLIYLTQNLSLAT